MKKDIPPDGEYLATCRERNPLSAAANGHSTVFHEADVVIKDGWAIFYRNGEAVWNCNARYAQANFDLKKSDK
ncbi:hypothetical protein [Burkholderia anthina]|uniref:hypothetical protein n=1 Tax=Burkholderia anthina TaxID=179879 RepID=UPI0037C04425